MMYFDNNATTRVDPEVLEAMTPYWLEHYGNPSSPHSGGRRPALAVAAARDALAALLNAPSDRFVFTSGGTESNALALHAALAAAPERREVVISAVEHASVRDWPQILNPRGYRVRVIPVDGNGALNLDALARALTPDTALVSVMLANNETGVVYPVAEVAALARSAGALTHTDAVQAVGKIPVDLAALGVDYASICAHKFHGPKGVGALYLRQPRGVAPLMPGGDQEFGVRPGTENVAGIVGLGAAATIAARWLRLNGPHAQETLRNAFEAWLLHAEPDAVILGRSQPRLPNTTLALFPGRATETVLARLDLADIAVSSGSACASGAHEPSHVLAAMGYDAKNDAVVRFSAGRTTTDADYHALRQALSGALLR
ncbi:MAG TPA: cysteine desulfurase family protein [Kiritimatiellia bacterium]|nr:cysteine desulfurase family protein [Kiritimatiellia bacterium]HMP00507.1 cysteine desulfurase family protein [Kiritimatiellia bacterium]HMP97907.1 cysteine desulfurase family protein [Kiritimatiellia bacterium]